MRINEIGQINLSDDGETLHPDLHLHLLSFSNFPKSAVDRRQAIAIVLDERSRYQRDPERYKPSSILVKLVEGAERRLEGHFSTALISLVALAFSAERMPITINRASDIVLAMRNAGLPNIRVPRRLPWQQGPDEINVRVGSSRAVLQGQYRTYSSVAHLLAADVWAGTAAKRGIFDNPSPIFMASIVSTASFIQRLTEPTIRSWPRLDRYWCVDSSGLKCVKTAGYLDVPSELYESIFSPFLRAKGLDKITDA